VWLVAAFRQVSCSKQENHTPPPAHSPTHRKHGKEQSPHACTEHSTPAKNKGTDLYVHLPGSLNEGLIDIFPDATTLPPCLRVPCAVVALLSVRIVPCVAVKRKFLRLFLLATAASSTLRPLRLKSDSASSKMQKSASSGPGSCSSTALSL
jgi:hypothetical protein